MVFVVILIFRFSFRLVWLLLVHFLFFFSQHCISCRCFFRLFFSIATCLCWFYDVKMLDGLDKNKYELSDKFSIIDRIELCHGRRTTVLAKIDIDSLQHGTHQIHPKSHTKSNIFHWLLPIRSLWLNRRWIQWSSIKFDE